MKKWFVIGLYLLFAYLIVNNPFSKEYISSLKEDTISVAKAKILFIRK